jgi:hypothetical protein
MRTVLGRDPQARVCAILGRDPQSRVHAILDG